MVVSHYNKIFKRETRELRKLNKVASLYIESNQQLITLEDNFLLINNPALFALDPNLDSRIILKGAGS